MRHRKSGRKLGVTTKHRKAMFRNMATDLLRNGKINTTDTRAKEIRRVVEKLVTLGKDGSLHARRKALGYIRDRAVVEKLFSELAERYMERPGGYTRIVKLGYRRGDNAPISLIELVTEEYKAKRKRRKAKPKAEAKTASKKSSKKKSAEELGLVEEEKAVENQADEQGEAEVTETVSKKGSKKKSAEEPGLVEEEKAPEKRADEQGEAEVAEPEPPEPQQEQADSPEKTED
jgi:large subunit ribosomal protein L17